MDEKMTLMVCAIIDCINSSFCTNHYVSLKLFPNGSISVVIKESRNGF